MATYNRNKIGKLALCIDWETSGSTWGGDSSIDYQGISFGAVIFDTTTYLPVKTLYRELQFDDSRYKWSAEAEAIHGISREYLKEHGVSREEALIDLLTLLVETMGPKPKVCLAGHNASYDMSFTDQLCDDFDMSIDWHHVVLDTSSLGFVTIGESKSDIVFDILGGLNTRDKHNALQDALTTLTVLRNVHQIFALGLEKFLS